jgi:hypothetical protein
LCRWACRGGCLGLFHEPLEFLASEGGVGKVADNVEEPEVAGRLRLDEFEQGIGSLAPNCLEELYGGGFAGGFVDFGGVEVSRAFEDVDGGFGLDPDAFDAFLSFEMILVAALFPVGDVLGVEAFTSVAELVDDDTGGQAVIDHAIDHVARFFGKAGDLAVAAKVDRFFTGSSSGGGGGEFSNEGVHK